MTAVVQRSDAEPLLIELLREAPFRVQTKVAQSLAGSNAGAEKLLKLVEESQASPQLLLDRTTADKIAGLKTGNAAERLKKATKGLSPNEAAQKWIDQRRAEYKPGPDAAVEGKAIFTQNCAVCHRIGTEGNLVGPQLDGIGNRGLERLLEDVLDPNRNVDRAFRTHIISLKDGDVTVGLPRREEGLVLVLADATGKELSIPKANIESRRESETSVMPSNFGDIIPPADFQKLMAFLLSKRTE
jgi:putative heme-binding domain-containing protein